MPAPRPLHTSRLSDGDLAAIGTHVGNVVREVLKEEMPEYFAKVGLAIGEDSDLIEVQQDHAYLRSLRKAAADNRSLVRRRILEWTIKGVGILLITGAVAVAARM